MRRKDESAEEANDRMKVFDSTAPHLMQVIRGLLMDDVTLRIARMADHAGSGQRTNLSLARLLADAKDQLTASDYDKASAALDAFAGLASVIEKRRSKMVAHADYAVETGAEAEPTFRTTDVDLCLSAAVAFMERVDPERGQSHFGYEHLIVQTDARHLIAALREARDSREERKRSRSWRQGD